MEEEIARRVRQSLLLHEERPCGIPLWLLIWHQRNKSWEPQTINPSVAPTLQCSTPDTVRIQP